MGVVDLVIQGGSALGSIGAAVVALVIAGRSDRARKREREDAAFAQARLVLVEVVDKPQSLDFLAVIQNHGREPILDVELRSVLYMPNSSARFVAVQPKGGYLSVLLPGEKVEMSFTFDAPHGGHNLWAYNNTLKADT